MNQIIKDLLKSGIKVTMEHNPESNSIEYIIDGFYKSGSVRLMECGDEEATMVAISRYEERTYIDSVQDIIQLNYDWWQRSKDRFDGWINPDPSWLPLLLKAGLVKEKTVKQYE